MVRNIWTQKLELKHLKEFRKLAQILEFELVNSYMITIYGKRKLPLFYMAYNRNTRMLRVIRHIYWRFFT